VFVGRQHELGELKAMLEDALLGHGRLVMITGEPGIGKTRTTQELAALAEQRGAEVLWGRCYEQQGAPPYWPWLQILRAIVQQTNADALQSAMGYSPAPDACN
jgi:predicted ATPase